MPDKIFSIGKAIRELVDRGDLTGLEREIHYTLQRDFESMSECKWLSASNARDQRFMCRLNFLLAK
jgi:hypothetical protein